VAAERSPIPGGPGREIAVAPPPPFTLRFLDLVALLFAGFVVYLYVRSTSGLSSGEAHEQIPAVVGIVAIALALVGIVVAAVGRRSLVLSESALTVRAGFYTRRVSRASLKVGGGVVGSLFDHREYAPRWRTNGIRVPGFQAGWFRLVNGEKALVLLTDPRVVTYLPTTKGYALVVSTSDLLPALETPGPPEAVDQG
jgi:hypothetical protein